MMRVKVEPENYKALQTAIKEAEGRAREKRITVKDIFDAVNDIEARLSITKKAMEGITARCNPWAQYCPASWRNIPRSTVFSLEYRKGCWYITDIHRDSCFQNNGMHLTFTVAAKEAIAEKLAKW